MFAIFRKRSSKLRSDLQKLHKQADAIIERADAHITEAYEVIVVLEQEIEDAQRVIDTLVRRY